MEIRVDFKKIARLELSMSQYLFLMALYYNKEIRDMVALTPEAKFDLVTKKFIRIEKGSQVVITPRACALFESNPELFNLFIETFPTRVTDPQGKVRILSPASTESLYAEKLRKKWYAITTNNTDLKDHILECLKAEITLRKNEGSLFWMRNIETWLNKGTWEDYAYLLEDHSLDDNKESHRRVGEIEI